MLPRVTNNIILNRDESDSRGQKIVKESFEKMLKHTQLAHIKNTYYIMNQSIPQCIFLKV